MTTYYQTRLESIAKILKRDFKGTKKNEIWEFEYTVGLGRRLSELRGESQD